LDIAPLPNTLRKLLVKNREERAREMERRVRHTLDPEDLAIAQHNTLERLARRIEPGKRNQTLFAIGCSMLLYEIEGWEDILIARGSELGLPTSEMRSVVSHVKQYSQSK